MFSSAIKANFLIVLLVLLVCGGGGVIIVWKDILFWLCDALQKCDYY
jgi:hypothetical protein